MLRGMNPASLVAPVAAAALSSFSLSSQPLSATERDEAFRRSIDELFPKLVETRRAIHANPELSNEEEETAALVAKRLSGLGLDVRTGVAKHGVVARLEGTAGESGRCAALRADMDALPIVELSGKPYRSKNAGAMHACGHDVHAAVALGVAEVLARHRDRFAGTVKFLFQPAEEGMPLTFAESWGAKRMVAEGAMEDPRPDAVFALHCRPTITPKGAGLEATRFLGAGQLAYASGPDSANSDTFEVVIRGRMAHGSAPHRGIDAIAVAAEAVTALQTIRSRRTDTRQPLVLTIGTIQGGRRHNILADEVRFTGTLRTYDGAFRDEVVQMMRQILDGVAAAHGASHVFEFREGYPSVHNDPALVEATLPTLRRIAGESNVIESLPGMGGEDFSHFAKVCPGFYFRLGVSNEAKGITGEIHTPGFDVDEECLKTGVAAMAAVICDFLGRDG